MPPADGAGERGTLAALFHDIAADLESAGLPRDTCRADAEVLLRHVLDIDAAEWLVRLRAPVPATVLERVARLVRRRRRREPVAYITGSKEFYGRPFTVTPDVLVPRPETEIVVTQALRAIAWCRSDGRSPVRVADVGTGSGCLAVTLALEARDVDIVATDLSASALQVAAVNASRLNAERIRFQNVDLLGGAADAFEVIVSNPPYVAEHDRGALMPDVADYEPPGALFGGHDGLAIIRQLLPAAGRALSAGGWLIMEIGANQANAVDHLVQDVGPLRVVRIVEDLAGHPRVVIVRREPAAANADSV